MINSNKNYHQLNSYLWIWPTKTVDKTVNDPTNNQLINFNTLLITKPLHRTQKNIHPPLTFS